ncbi:MAG: hypothetical protein Q8M31_05355 [Beijerinckiaceae bacterium]|nr:hypothetical protein [Beijerinckiaceae bacterium]
MAELSDADKKGLLGDDWKRKAAELDASRGITDISRSAAKKEETASNLIKLAMSVGFVAFLIGLANYFSRGTPYNVWLVTGCAVIVIASAAIAVWFWRERRSGAYRSGA